MDIARWDSRFARLERLPADVTFYDSRTEPFRGYGLYAFREGPIFRRMPAEVAEAVSPGVATISRHTAGGRLRFRTDSPYIVLRSILTDATWMSHMAFVGSCGFAVYAAPPALRSRYCGSIIPREGDTERNRAAVEGVIRFADRTLREITIYFPLYSGVRDLWIGLASDARVLPDGGYRYAQPVVYYGSSITQGGCASRPGNSYEGFISRRLDCDYINLGFSGNGKGEPAMADYLAGLPASVYVLDYDHNAPDLSHLQRTHEALFLRLRRSHPETPVLLISAPDPLGMPDGLRRRDTIRSTYEHALAAGDRHVYFLDGQSLFRTPYPPPDGGDTCGLGAVPDRTGGAVPAGVNAEAEDDGSYGDCTVDGSHPNDLGFYRMARHIGDVLARCLGAA